MKLLPLLVLLSLPVFGCGGDDSGTVDAGPIDVEALLASTCTDAGCHASMNPANGLDLQSPGVADRINGQQSPVCSGEVVVVGGDPASSYILDKLRGEQPASCGVRMPSGKAPLSDAEIDAIADWIAGLPPPGGGGGGPDAMPDTGADAMLTGGGGTGGPGNGW